MRYLLRYVLFSFLAFILVSCDKDHASSNKPKDHDFDNHEEYLENPSVSDAISESGIDIHEGTSPPVLSGEYSASGSVTDASTDISDQVGMPISSTITLYNQTSSGYISMSETVGGITVYGSGGYITGTNNDFTIWQESEQSGSEAGLPDDLSLNVSLLVSGTKLNDGDLQLSGISIITNVVTDNDDYDAEMVEGLWWMYDANFNLLGPAGIQLSKNVHEIGLFNNKIVNRNVIRILSN